MDLEKTIKNLKLRGFKVSYFESKDEAASYMNSQISNTTVGIGGSKTVEALGLYESLIKNNTVYWHWKENTDETRNNANASKVYISSANAISEDGEILNIDGAGNRLAGQVYGKKRVYIVAGTNKIEENFEKALNRARNVAAVTNVKRFAYKPPCTIDGKCHDCRSEDRICNALLVLWGPMFGMETEVVLIGEELGY